MGLYAREHGNALTDDIEPTVRVKPEALARRKAEMEARKSGTKNEENMDKKKRSSRPRRVCQIDPETLQVVKTYDSCSEGCRAAGVKSIERAIKKLQKAGGYYWQYPEDVATFADRLKKQQEERPKPKAKAEKKQAKVKNDFPTATATQVPAPKFNVGDEVWARQPNEFYGRKGHILAVDTRSMMYDVCFGDELWRVSEKDLGSVAELTYHTDYVYTLTDTASGADRDAVRNAAHEALAVFTDDELLYELDSRGWQGEIRKVMVVTIGAK